MSGTLIRYMSWRLLQGCLAMALIGGVAAALGHRLDPGVYVGSAIGWLLVSALQYRRPGETTPHSRRGPFDPDSQD